MATGLILAILNPDWHQQVLTWTAENLHRHWIFDFHRMGFVLRKNPRAGRAARRRYVEETIKESQESILKGHNISLSSSGIPQLFRIARSPCWSRHIVPLWQDVWALVSFKFITPKTFTTLLLLSSRRLPVEVEQQHRRRWRCFEKPTTKGCSVCRWREYMETGFAEVLVLSQHKKFELVCS